MPKLLITILAALALLAPLAFTPLFDAAEDRVRDAKAQALRSGEFGDWDPHELLDAAKQDRVESAMAAAETVDQAIPTPAPCTAGFVGPYPCQNVDLAAIVPLAELGGAAGNDSWGWTDPENGNEIAIVGTGTGVAFVDVTDPTIPVVLGRVESEVVDSGALWRDLKVDDDHAFIVSENSGHGMQVFDLTRLREFYGTPNPANLLEPDHVDTSIGSAHNIAINPETDTAYVIGAGECDGGLHMIDISDPLNTSVAGCYDTDGYVHDTQCVVYHGPDEDYNGQAEDDTDGPSEICFANIEERGVAIVDVTDKANPVQLASIGYSTARYSHQGWLTPDHRNFVFNDELDEQGGSVDNTTTYVLTLDDLDHGRVLMGDNSGLISSYSHSSVSTDHNLYITDANEELGAGQPFIWEANYNQGLQVMAYDDEEALRNGELKRVGYFRVDSLADAPHYGDTWNVYPFFSSGTVILSNIGQGLVVLQPNYEGLTEAAGS